jgi:hypothetical protein
VNEVSQGWDWKISEKRQRLKHNDRLCSYFSLACSYDYEKHVLASETPHADLKFKSNSPFFMSDAERAFSVIE